MFYKIIDNFLPEHELISLYNCILNKVKWSYSSSIATPEDTSGFYFYSALHETKDIEITRNLNILENRIRQKIDPLLGTLFKVRACLYTKSNGIIEHAFHTDDELQNLTIVFYLNNNNGYTRLKINDNILKIESKQNRLLAMDGELEHASSTCTDNDIRLVLNFNFILN